MNRPIFAVAATIAAALAVPAAAGSVGIEYRDLDLTTAQGQKVLEQRIDRTARNVCGIGATTTGTRMQASKSQECYKRTKQQATEQMASLVSDKRLGG